MNPKNLVAPDQDAAAVSAHADASIASITAVANSPLSLLRYRGQLDRMWNCYRSTGGASAVAHNCRPPEEELSYGDPRFARSFAIASSARSKSRRRLQVIVALALEPAIRP